LILLISNRQVGTSGFNGNIFVWQCRKTYPHQKVFRERDFFWHHDPTFAEVDENPHRGNGKKKESCKKKQTASGKDNQTEEDVTFKNSGQF